jgi:hypothetical protein
MENRFSPVRHAAFVVIGKLGLQLVVERIARFFVPEEIVLRQRLRVLDRGGLVEAAVRVDGELLARSEDFQHGFDAPQVIGQRAPPIFFLTTV